MKTYQQILIATIFAITIPVYADQSLVGTVYDPSHAVNHAVKLNNGKVVQDFKVDQNLVAAPEAITKSTAADNQQAIEDYTGQAAIDFLGANITKTAESLGQDVEYLKQQILNDPTVHVDANGNVFIVEENHLADIQKAAKEAGATAVASASNTVAGAFTMPPDVFKLHTRPNATKRIYLNFVGNPAINDLMGAGNAKPYTVDADPTTYSPEEQYNIYEIWSTVANDYAPFDVDVTTEKPTDDQINRSSASDQEYGTMVMITSSLGSDFTGALSTWAYNAGGVAYINVFDVVNPLDPTLPTYNPTYRRLAFAFTHNLGNWNYAIAEASSHEAGHTLGLTHHGLTANSNLQTCTNGSGVKVNCAYYYGHGVWAPIMGASYYRPKTQWCTGSYPDASNPTQSDLTVISGKVPYVADLESDVANGSQTIIASLTTDPAFSLLVLTDRKNGLLNSASDVDMFNFAIPEKASVYISTNATISDKFDKTGNADVKVTVLDSNGNVITVDDDKLSYNSAIDLTLEAGKYYVKVEASDKPSNNIDDFGYPTYDSIGDYQLVVNYYPVAVPTPQPTSTPTPQPTVPPTVQPTARPTTPPTVTPQPTTTPQPTATPNPMPVAKIDVSTKKVVAPNPIHFSGLNSTSPNGVIDYYWTFGDGYITSNPEFDRIFKQSGLIDVTLRVTDSNGFTDNAYTQIRSYSPAGPAYHVKAIAVSTVGKKPTSLLKAKVTVVDQSKKAFSLVQVHGKFSGFYREYKGGPAIDISAVFPDEMVLTPVKGVATFATYSPINMTGGGTIAFTVTDVTTSNETYFYDAAKNAVVTKTLVKK